MIRRNPCRPTVRHEVACRRRVGDVAVVDVESVLADRGRGVGLIGREVGVGPRRAAARCVLRSAGVGDFVRHGAPGADRPHADAAATAPAHRAHRDAGRQHAVVHPPGLVAVSRSGIDDGGMQRIPVRRAPGGAKRILKVTCPRDRARRSEVGRRAHRKHRQRRPRHRLEVCQRRRGDLEIWRVGALLAGPL